jgi:hypothetical protein
MGSERVLDVAVRRHVFDSQLPFQAVLDGIFGGISQPDIESLFGKLQASTSYEQFSGLVRQAQGSAGLMRFWQLDLDTALARDPQARDKAGRRLVRLIAYDSVASEIAPYGDADASAVAERLDGEVLGLLRQVTRTT